MCDREHRIEKWIIENGELKSFFEFPSLFNFTFSIFN